jgi:DNA-binding Lrp family transcriptional regulator
MEPYQRPPTRTAPWGCGAGILRTDWEAEGVILEMIAAYILIQTEVGASGRVAAEVAGIKGVTSADGVTGPCDVIARAEANDLDELGKLVVGRIQAVAGVTRTLTCPVVHM